jgi:hypothetical protein
MTFVTFKYVLLTAESATLNLYRGSPKPACSYVTYIHYFPMTLGSMN